MIGEYMNARSKEEKGTKLERSFWLDEEASREVEDRNYIIEYSLPG